MLTSPETILNALRHRRGPVYVQLWGSRRSDGITQELAHTSPSGIAAEIVVKSRHVDHVDSPSDQLLPAVGAP